MTKQGFDAEIERVRRAAADRLPDSCREDFQRLSRTLVYGAEFQWLLVDAPDETLRKQIMKALDDVLRAAGLSSNRLPLSNKIIDVASLEARLVKNARAAAVVHVIGRPGWFTAARWDAFNVRRERLAADANARLVFWLDADAIALASRGAPDLWAWRGGVYAFSPSEATLSAPNGVVYASGSSSLPASAAPQFGTTDNRSLEERLQRIAEIRQWLATVPAPPDELLAAPTDELGRLLFSVGDFEAALQHWRTVELALHERMGNLGSKAVTMGQIADILQMRGQLDEALRIRQEEELPVFERLGDVREKAIAMGKIADILQIRGQLDEALRIRQQEELSVFERLGDVRSKAITMGKIADILQIRGQLDEALALHEQRLPLIEKIGFHDVVAHVHFSLARVRLARGDDKHGGLPTILKHLATAFAISLETQNVVAIANIGKLFAQVLAQDGQRVRALEVQGQVDAACKTQGHAPNMILSADGPSPLSQP
jgi:tetratricopeptide (TPR) repeat protein